MILYDIHAVKLCKSSVCVLIKVDNYYHGAGTSIPKLMKHQLPHYLITSLIVGAGTRIPKHLLLIAGMTLLVELQQRMRRHVAVYFSIVLLKAC